MSSMVMTVRGPVPAAELGVTLPHEHLLMNMYTVTRNPDHVLDDPENAVAELAEYARAGGRSLVDCTNPGLAQDPIAIRSISEQTGVHVVMGCGWYREPAYPAEIQKRSVTDLTTELVGVINNGVDDGIRPGIIGEIGADREWLSGIEERVLRAAARAHLQTGLPIITHAMFAPVGLWQIDVLVEEGVPASRIAVSHCDSYPHLSYHEAIIDRGAFVLYDRNGPQDALRQERRVRNIVSLLRGGRGGSLMLSHDVCKSSDRKGNGGPGYSYVLTDVVPALTKLGVSREQIATLLVENPRRLLEVERV